MTTTDPITEPITLPAGPGAGDPGRPRQVAPGGEPPRAASRWWLLLAWFLAFLLLASHDIGQLTFDTKLGVDIDPVGFYQRLPRCGIRWSGSAGCRTSTSATRSRWARSTCSATLLGVPVWLVERLWMSVLVAAGCWGVVRLAERLGIGGPREPTAGRRSCSRCGRPTRS